ncbi:MULTISPECIES: hypothetical protein [unclassified Bradyrhizobium]|uniref:hypothetical protein n=1 Tax=unclassified Bradyrhizobium TaxID=2631580 RepID=UPI001FF58E5C|nr:MULTISPECIES: hypothetical protein [unclassified Bradyrhizobium]MCJ9701863.1 hypothetical protein [Bradyrhizobium sp. SHOUNA76]MCJ9731450.1 hypothetical protein [Bradyrhizobium sp. PRIMUS42]
MRGVVALRRQGMAVAVCVLAGLLLSGCKTFDGQPDRLYPVATEVESAKTALDAMALSYKDATNDEDRKRHRNEYIALRMYIIDAEFTNFESALTRERGEFGFTTALTTQALSTAGAVFTPANTVRTLSALAGGVNATRGFYDSELLVSKTIQIIQSQMEAKRDDVAARIIKKVDYPPTTYPLAAALHDLEDYYRAGTLTAGLIKATAEAGDAALEASDKKTAAMVLQGGTFNRNDQNMQLVQRYLSPADPKILTARTALLTKCLVSAGFNAPPANYAVDPSSTGVRLIMIKCASDARDPMK